eukprot:UN12335
MGLGAASSTQYGYFIGYFFVCIATFFVAYSQIVYLLNNNKQHDVYN